MQVGQDRRGCRTNHDISTCEYVGGRDGIGHCQIAQEAYARDVGLIGLTHHKGHVGTGHIAYEARALHVAQGVSASYEERGADVPRRVEACECPHLCDVRLKGLELRGGESPHEAGRLQVTQARSVARVELGSHRIDGHTSHHAKRVARAARRMDPHIALGVDDHGQSRKIPELGDIVAVAGPAALELSHLESRGSSGVVDAQGIGHLGVGGGDNEITRHGEIGGCDVSKTVKSGSGDEIAAEGRVTSHHEGLGRCRRQHVQGALDVAVAHL